MVLTHDYVTPRDNWVRYFEKPPLVYWAEALSIKLLGANELAVRLPAAIASAAEWRRPRRWAKPCSERRWDSQPRSWDLLPSCSASPVSPPSIPRRVFRTAALSTFWVAAHAAGFDSVAGRRWFLMSAAMAAAGTLTKGPAALVLTGAVGLAWLLGERRAREIYACHGSARSRSSRQSPRHGS